MLERLLDVLRGAIVLSHSPRYSVMLIDPVNKRVGYAFSLAGATCLDYLFRS
jgi:hypothetical protein